MGFLGLLRCSPATFQSVFTHQPGSITADSIIALLDFGDPTEVEMKAAQILVEVLRQATNEG